MSIVDLPAAKAQLGIPDSDTSADDVLAAYLLGITSAVEDYKREVIEARPVTERVRFTGGARFRLWSVPVIELTTITSLDGSTTWSIDGMYPDTDTGLVDVLGTMPVGIANVTYRAGYDNVPDNYKQGALVILLHVWGTQRGVGTAMPGVDDDGNYDPRWSYSIPRKALEWLGAPRPVVG